MNDKPTYDDLVELLRVSNERGRRWEAEAQRIKMNFKLSQRETQILQCFANGKRYKSTADMLGISLDTVRTHVRRMYGKMGVHGAAEAVLKWQLQENTSCTDS